MIGLCVWTMLLGLEVGDREVWRPGHAGLIPRRPLFGRDVFQRFHARCDRAGNHGPSPRLNASALHELLEPPEIPVDLHRRLLSEHPGDPGAELAAWRMVLEAHAHVRARSSSSKFTEPAVTTVDPAIERHPMTLSGTSLMISASHSTVVPSGAVATQRERRSSSTVTDCRCSITRGRFSSARQNA